MARLYATLLNRAPVSAGLQRHLLIGAPPLPPAPDTGSLIDWEFCKTEASDDWHLDRVQALIRSYREAGGLCKSEEYLAFIPFIRWRLCQELRHHFALVAHAAWRT